MEEPRQAYLPVLPPSSVEDTDARLDWVADTYSAVHSTLGSTARVVHPCFAFADNLYRSADSAAAACAERAEDASVADATGYTVEHWDESI